MGKRGNRLSVLMACALLLNLAACSGESSGDDPVATSAATTATTTAPATTTTAAPATTSTTAAPAATTTTIPGAADIEAIVTAYVLGNCDWPEAYPDGSDPVVATWEDIDAASGDLSARRDEWGFPVWEMPADSAELDAAGLYGYAHRIVDLPGITLVSGAYLFQSPEQALAALDVVEATFGDAPTMAAITGLPYELTTATRLQDDPNATSVVFQIEAPNDAWRPRAVRAAAFVVDDVMAFVRGAYPVLDVPRFQAYNDAEFAVVARMIGSPIGLPAAPLAPAAPDVGSAVAMADDPWAGGTVAVSGMPQMLPGDFWTGPEVYSLSAAEVPPVGTNPAATPLEIAAFRDFDVTAFGGLGPVYTGMLRFDDAAAAEQGFGEIAAVYNDPEQMMLLTLPRPLDTITPVAGPAVGDELLAVAATFGDGTEADGLQVIGIVWRTGRDVQWIRTRTGNNDAAATIDAAVNLAEVLAGRLPADLPAAAPALNEGCGRIEGTGAAVLDEPPWLTDAAVLADGDPWVATGAADALVLSREEAAGFGDADWDRIRQTSRDWGVTVSQAESPAGPEFFTDDRLPRLAVAYRVHPGDGAGPVLWTGAILFEDTEWDDPETADTVEQFLTSGMGWASVAGYFDPDYAAGNGWLFQIAGEDAPPVFDESTLLQVPNLGEQIAAAVITGVDSPDQVAGIVWRNGGLTQWVRARMPAGDDATLQAMIAVAEAMASRAG